MARGWELRVKDGEEDLDLCFCKVWTVDSKLIRRSVKIVSICFRSLSTGALFIDGNAGAVEGEAQAPKEFMDGEKVELEPATSAILSAAAARSFKATVGSTVRICCVVCGSDDKKKWRRSPSSLERSSCIASRSVTHLLRNLNGSMLPIDWDLKYLLKSTVFSG